ncbi:MAG: Histone transcription regulator 3 [Bathelium mastoideum]|nr:MAG: Histone transcription regulator 3 [Bathelium mastoideum]
MASFKALNIESDDESDDEIDDTKEVQIEEALKLYQTALKYHSQGPHSYDKAGDAYRALFESEIFRYPESLSEVRRHQVYGAPPEDELRPYDAAEKLPIAATGSVDSAPSTLPQILHLSYKNHGEYILDLLRSGRDEGIVTAGAATAQITSRGQPLVTADAALEYFVEALDKDSTDLDLWRRTSSIAASLGSRRMARYCLEALLDKQTNGVTRALTLPGIQDILAASDYDKISKDIGDDLTMPRESKFHLRAKKLAAAFESLSGASLAVNSSLKIQVPLLAPHPASRIILIPLKQDWVEVGEALLRQYLMERDALVETASSCGIFLNVAEPPPVIANGIHPIVPSFPSGKEELSNGVPPEVVLSSPQVPAEELIENERESEEVKQVEESKNADGDKDNSEAKDESSRKRSHESAGLGDSSEGMRVRSKRIRARDSAADVPSATEEVVADPWKLLEQQLAPCYQTDDILFETLATLLRKIGLDDVPQAERLREMTYRERDSSSPPNSAMSFPGHSVNIATSDFQSALRLRSNDLARMLLATGDSIDELGGNSPQAGLAAILGHAKRPTTKTSSRTLLLGEEGLTDFAQGVNDKWTHIQEAALAWVQHFLKPGHFPGLDRQSTSYTTHFWSDPLKALVVRMIVNLDEFIFTTTLESFEGKVTANNQPANQERQDLVEMIQTLFELHLDVYSLIKHPGSGVDISTQTLQKERLARWSELAQSALQQVSYGDDQFRNHQILRLRHLWATAFHLSVCDGVAQDHVILCLEDVKNTIQDCGNTTIDLQNNAVMPEISVAAIEREISRLTTKDFFIRVFDPYQSDPVAVIESLEPVLEASLSAQAMTSFNGGHNESEADSNPGQTAINGSGPNLTCSSNVSNSPVFDELFKFLESGSMSVKLSLWQRLREAYEAIEYPSKIMSCYLRSIECMVQEMGSPSYRESTQDQRHYTLMRILSILDGLCLRVLTIADGSKDAFDCVDIDHIQSSLWALVFFAGLLHTFTIYHDALRIGQIQPLQGDGGTSSLLPMLASKIQDMQIRLWKLIYILFSEGLMQSTSPSSTPTEDRFDLLRAIHGATGIRGFCRSSTRAFLRLLKKEMLQMNEVEGFEAEFAQVLFDLYGLDVFPNHLPKQDHGCTPEPLDRKTALALLDFVLTQASRVNIKDLPKTELKKAIEKIHGSLPKSKPSEGMLRNQAVYRAKVKSPIQPLNLFQCLDGVGGLPSVRVSPSEAPAASKGWYFLMGQIALTRFRSQKRVGPVPTEDVMLAIAFFVQDIQYSADKWETWYRLAQAYDVQVEESVLWSAEGLNNHSQDIVQNQRAAIHCYTLAVALAVQTADLSSETSSKMADLYADFGTRIYSSSREPFSMAAFSVDDFERTFSGEVLYKKTPFKALQPYSAWKFAAALFRRAIVGKPENWTNYYMLGKCLWKMHCAEGAGLKAPTVDIVLDAFVKAIQALPERRDNRQYPILEPHYKLVAIVYKLVARSELEMSVAVQLLSDSTPYAQGAVIPEEPSAWSTYILQVLKSMRAADKSNWHHRMTARAASIVYKTRADEEAVNAAKQELMQQIFTKTMTVQVWKPENERPGRHIVYTTRYSLFFVKLLVQSGDRANLEALSKRLRRKTNDFLHHNKLWQDVCQSYLHLLRRIGNVPEGEEDVVFKSVHADDFHERSVRIETWLRQPTSPLPPLLDVLRETIELKKLNNSLMRSTMFDDLIGDAYALLYNTVGADLEAEAKAAEAAGIVAATETSPPTAAPAPPAPPKEREGGVMSLSNMMNLDGAPTPIEQAPTPPPQPVRANLAQPAKFRFRGVHRRDIRQAAEVATQKATVAVAAPPTAPSKSAVQASSSTTTTTVAVAAAASNTNSAAAPGTSTAATAAETPHPQTGLEAGKAEASGRESGGEEESELSELEEEGEEIIVRPLFPGLAGREKDGQSEEGGKGSGEG